MVAFEGTEGIIVYIILGTLAAIIYSLRILVLLERRISRIDINIDKIARRILEEELKIEKEEQKIEAIISKVGKGARSRTSAAK
ncbi:hypothetical protein J4439_06775 [Candidatus Woesearchaeota archaeon]|nr:hypothetical protein [Candidatus Woesearchaeota archaeon]